MLSYGLSEELHIKFNPIMRGDHCHNSTLYKIIYSDHLITGLQVRQQTVRIHKQPSDMFK